MDSGAEKGGYCDLARTAAAAVAVATVSAEHSAERQRTRASHRTPCTPPHAWDPPPPGGTCTIDRAGLG